MSAVPGSRALRSIVPGTEALHMLDIALAVWVAVWVGLGVAIGVELSNLSNLSHTVIQDGRAVQSVGRSLGLLANLPLVGAALSTVPHQVEVAGAAAAAGASSSESSIHALSVLLAVAVALLPSVPVFGFYLPVRLDLRREARALRLAVALHAEDPEFRAFLARRAIDSMGYHRLSRLAALPWSPAPSDGDCTELAAAELTRLGIDPSLLQGSRTGTPSPADRSRS